MAWVLKDKPPNLKNLVELYSNGLEVFGDENVLKKETPAKYFAQITEAGDGTISYAYLGRGMDIERLKELVLKTKASVVFVDARLKDHLPVVPGKLWLYHQHPKAAFYRMVGDCVRWEEPKYANHFEYGGVKIGKGTIIEAGVKILSGTVIGCNVVIHAPAFIAHHCFIKSGAVIGGEGYGFIKNGDREWENVPHTGGVFIDSHVFIGSSTCVDKGLFYDTCIGFNSKIDNLVHVAHDVRIGSNCLVIAGADLGGNLVVGDDTRVSVGANVMNSITLGKNVTVGIGSTVLKSVADGQTVYGCPAKPREQKYTEVMGQGAPWSELDAKEAGIGRD